MVTVEISAISNSELCCWQHGQGNYLQREPAVSLCFQSSRRETAANQLLDVKLYLMDSIEISPSTNAKLMNVLMEKTKSVPDMVKDLFFRATGSVSRRLII